MQQCTGATRQRTGNAGQAGEVAAAMRLIHLPPGLTCAAPLLALGR